MNYTHVEILCCKVNSVRVHLKSCCTMWYGFYLKMSKSALFFYLQSLTCERERWRKKERERKKKKKKKKNRFPRQKICTLLLFYKVVTVKYFDKHYRCTLSLHHKSLVETFVFICRFTSHTHTLVNETHSPTTL